MDFTSFTIQILVLFLPGIIATVIVETLTPEKQRPAYYFVVFAFVNGFLSYLFLSLVVFVLFKTGLIVDQELGRGFWMALEKAANGKPEAQIPIDSNSIFWATMSGIIVGFIMAAVIRHGLVFRLARFLRVSKKYSDDDVWGYALNSTSRGVGWATIRDTKNDLTFDGWIHAFSEGLPQKEVFLEQVKVYQSSTSKLIYDLPALYLPFRSEDMFIEFRAVSVPKDAKEKGNEDNNAK
ncbi:hypothetical protein IT157_10410 [bacterium]|nr:hypothetical protein [bacterium]